LMTPTQELHPHPNSGSDVAPRPPRGSNPLLLIADYPSPSVGSFDRLRPFAYRIARLATASGPHNLGLRFADGVLTMRVEPATGLKLTVVR